MVLRILTEPKAIARHEIKCTLEDVIREASQGFKTRVEDFIWFTDQDRFGRYIMTSYECVQN